MRVGRSLPPLPARRPAVASLSLTSPHLKACHLILRSPRGLGQQAAVVLIVHPARDCMADLIESGKVPTVRKIPASLRFDGLNRAIVAVEENTRAVRLFLQHEPATVVAQPGELLDEVVFAHVLERREPGDLGISHTHLPWPAAAGGATLTFVEDRHGATVIRSCPCSRPAAPAWQWMDASRATMCIG